jgi:hypothetical protein
MSEQNNTCDHQRECGICYEKKRWGCDGGDFIEGENCEHTVCTDCSVRINRCPFCRSMWREIPTVAPRPIAPNPNPTECDECGATHSNHWRRFVDTQDGTARMVWWCSECWGVPEDYIEGEEVGFVPEVLEERQTEEDEDEEEPTDLFAELMGATEHGYAEEPTDLFAEILASTEHGYEEYWLEDRQFNCADCIPCFEAGDDFCRTCRFDMNQFNEEEDDEDEE